jgi:hypothetical protein
MSEVLTVFTEPIVAPDGTSYDARVCGAPFDNVWEGWIEFTRHGAVAGDGATIRTPRETEQPNRRDVSYWATGLTYTYLEGALNRALRPAVVPRVVAVDVPPAAPGPAPHYAPVDTGPRAVLDPFAVYEQGEDVLRRELMALSVDHLRNIARAYALHADPGAISSREELVVVILDSVRRAQTLP